MVQFLGKIKSLFDGLCNFVRKKWGHAIVFDGLSIQSVIRMPHWHHTMVDGTEFWINCEQLRLLRKVSHWQLILNSEPSTIVWWQCNVTSILNYLLDFELPYLTFKPTKRQSLNCILTYDKKNQSCYTSFHFVRNWLKLTIT